MTFGNSKRMALVKDFLKEDKKKSKSKRSVRSVTSKEFTVETLSLSASSSHSNKSTTSHSSSSIGSGDAFHCKRILKIQKTWENIKRTMTAKEIGSVISQKCKQTDLAASQCLVLVENLDCLIYLLSPDMDDEDVQESMEALSEQNIPMVQVAVVLADAMEECLGKNLSEDERETWQDSLGQTLINMSKLA